ncbi:protein of unknown function [Paraburkholderia kururiensis]
MSAVALVERTVAKTGYFHKAFGT